MVATAWPSEMVGTGPGQNVNGVVLIFEGSRPGPMGK